MTEHRRPEGRNHEDAPGEHDESRQERDRASGSGGDAAAAGTVEEREAIAKDEDDTWDSEDE